MEKETIREKVLKLVHPIILKALSSRRNFKLIVEGIIPEGRQFIFVANHFGIDDIPTAGEIIGRHTFVLVSDEDRGTLNGMILNLNGVVWTNRLNKVERKRSKEDLLRHLKIGHSILMYPEATWNLSPNLLMLPMNFGCITLALETSVPIVPIYLFFTDDTCYAKINRPFYPDKNKVIAIEKLRDIMATSSWYFMEKFDKEHRANLEKDYWEKKIKERYDKYDRARKDPEGVKAYESQFIFRSPDTVSPKEAFEHLKQLIPCRENAFLFRDIMKDEVP